MLVLEIYVGEWYFQVSYTVVEVGWTFGIFRKGGERENAWRVKRGVCESLPFGGLQSMYAIYQWHVSLYLVYMYVVLYIYWYVRTLRYDEALALSSSLSKSNPVSSEHLVRNMIASIELLMVFCLFSYSEVNYTCKRRRE